MPFDKSKYDTELGKKLYYPPISVKLKRANPKIMDALEDAALLQHTTKAEYTRNALIQKLVEDGFLDKRDI